MIGDKFLFDTFSSLQGLKSEASIRCKDPPYLYKFCNLSAYYQNPLSDVETAIGRIHNSLVEALNNHIYLPKYVIIIPDKDILESITKYIWSFGVTDYIEEHLTWLLTNISKCLLARRDDLKFKNPGSITADLTRVIWVPMLKCPITDDRKLQCTWQLRGKYNSMLYKILAIEKYMHVLPIDNMEELKYFDNFGNLTNLGKSVFWQNLNDRIKKMEFRSSENQLPTQKLPTLPPQRH